MKTKLFALLAILWFSGNFYAQEISPLISGTVRISITEGTFECDLTMSDIPRIKDYLIRINSGMNILHFRSLEPNNFVVHASKNHKQNTYEAISYYFPDNTGKGKFLPQKLGFRYGGKYPVATDTIANYSSTDWKGNIAFNGYSVRTDGFQTAWYPVLYDVELDKMYSDVRYDVEIICEDAEVIYLNGSLPYQGTRKRFTSETPQQMSLFIGNYNVKNIDGTYFLNPNIDDIHLKNLGEFVNGVEKYYADNLSIPYGKNVVFVNTTPTSRYNGWMFVTFPSIFNISQKGLSDLIDPKWENSNKGFFAHELGHYYFGAYKTFNASLGDAMSEGFAEYLSMKVMHDLVAKEAYDESITRKLKRLEEFAPTSFSKIQSMSDYKNRELYSYNYAPLLYEAIEKEIGSKSMWKWLNVMLITKTDFTDYSFILSTLGAVVKEDKVRVIREKYLESDDSMANIRKILEEKK